MFLSKRGIIKASIKQVIPISVFICFFVLLVNITVSHAAPPPKTTITVDNETVASGESITLTWTSANANIATIEPDIGIVDLNGFITLTIYNTTTYTITVSNGKKIATDSVTVYTSGLLDVTLQATPQDIPSGGTSYLTWTSTNADTVSIDQGVGSVALNSTGQGIPVSPTQTTIYTITATGPNGTATKQATVTVVPQPTISFDANPATIEPGGSSSLSWTTTNADSVSIDQNIGSVAPNGSITITPSTTTTYTITATGTGGTTSAQTTVTVAPLPTVNISANPQSILSGESSLLSWNSTNADTVSIDNGIGSVALNDSLSVTPAITTTYTITATGNGGADSAQTTITVGSDNSGTVENAELTPGTIQLYPGDTGQIRFHATNDNSFGLISYGIVLRFDEALDVSNLITTPTASAAKIDMMKKTISLLWKNLEAGAKMNAYFDVSSSTISNYNIIPDPSEYTDINRNKHTGTCNSAVVQVVAETTPPSTPTMPSSKSGRNSVFLCTFGKHA